LLFFPSPFPSASSPFFYSPATTTPYFSYDNYFIAPGEVRRRKGKEKEKKAKVKKKGL